MTLNLGGKRGQIFIIANYVIGRYCTSIQEWQTISCDFFQNVTVTLKLSLQYETSYCMSPSDIFPRNELLLMTHMRL